MPSPRQIAIEKNRGENFDRGAADYDAVAGTPPGLVRESAEPSYNADPVNPPDPPAPVRNLKR
jgi:hypothetical protein